MTLFRPTSKNKCLLKRLTSSKVEIRKFLATPKQITQKHFSCITDCHNDFEKGKDLENTLKQILKVLSSFYNYDVINELCPNLHALTGDATNSLGEINFISTVYQTFKNFDYKGTTSSCFYIIKHTDFLVFNS